MNGFVFVLFFGLVIAIILFQYSRYDRLIREMMESIGVTDYDCCRQWGFLSIGPYKWVGKGQTVYMISYEKDGAFKEAWVKFGSWGGPDWRL